MIWVQRITMSTEQVLFQTLWFFVPLNSAGGM